MQFKILGPLEVVNDQKVCTPNASKVRQVLAMLLLRANQVVGMDSLIEELWEENPPNSAVTTIQTYIYQLRRLFAREAPAIPRDNLLITKAPGYVLRLDENQCDVTQFNRLLGRGRALLDDGQARDAAARLREALDLWSGPVLANVTRGPLLNSYAAHLEERRISALELKVTADMRLGRFRELIAELKSHVATHPLNEWLHAQLITALAAAGRRGEALRAYQDVRRLLNDKLGLDPSLDLQRIHQELLSSDTVLPLPLPRHQARSAVS